MNMFEDSVTYQFIGNVPKGGDGVPADILNLPEGAVAITNEQGAVYANATAVGTAVGDDARMRIAQKVNGELIFSPYFRPIVTPTVLMPYSEEVPQISYLGYNGTGEALDAVANCTYTLGVVLQNTQGVLNNTPMIKTIPAFNAGGTQLELANTLKDAFDRMMGKANRRAVVCERVANGTAAEIATTNSNLLRVTQGATLVTVHVCTNGATIANTGSVNITTGETLFLPSTNGRVFQVTPEMDEDHLILIGADSLAVDVATPGAPGTAEALRDAINADSSMSRNVIASVDGNDLVITYRPGFYALPPVLLSDGVDTTLEVETILGDDQRIAFVYSETNATADEFHLDTPWQGSTGFIANESGNDRDNDAAEADNTTDWGLMFVGQAPDPHSFRTVTETYHPVTFKLSWERIGAPAATGADPTVITYDTGAQPSRGSFFEVAAREIYATMNEGNSQIGAYPPTVYRGAARPGVRYNTYIINAIDAQYISPTTGQRPISKYNIYVALNQDAAADVLEFAELL